MSQSNQNSQSRGMCVSNLIDSNKRANSVQTINPIPRSTDVFLFLVPFFPTQSLFLPSFIPSNPSSYVFPIFLHHPSLGPLTCPLPSSLAPHLPSPSFVLSCLSSPRPCVSLLAWVAAVIPASPSVIRGQCRNRCMAGWISDNTTCYRPSTLSFVITDSSVKKEAGGGGRRILCQGLFWGEIEEQRLQTKINPFTPHILNVFNMMDISVLILCHSEGV